ARTGDVLAWVGGRDYAHSQFDRVEQARRQPGSAFKPFVYAAALARGWVLSQPLVDQPLQVKMPNGQIWKPRNFTGRYEGRVSMRDALVRSKNVATVRLAGSLGLERVVELAKEAGIEEPISAVPSLALGTITVSPLELTSAYTAFATLGQAAEPRILLRVENEDGKVLWRSELERHEVLQPAVAYLVTDVLSEALVRGTGSIVQQTGLKVPAAGKTGTTNEGTDAWFVGYTPEIAAGVWIGFDQNRPILQGATGGQLAAPVWGRVMARVYEKRRQPRPWRRPVEVVSRPMDPSTGLVIEERCAKSDSPRELFVEGLVPASYCPGRENPPRNGFPAQQQMIAERLEREAQEERLAEQRREAEEETRIARLAEAEERELRQEEIALIAEARRREQLEEAKEEKQQETQTQEQARREEIAARQGREEERALAQRRERQEREAQRADAKEPDEAKKREQARRAQIAEQRKAEEQKRAQLQERRERLAKAKADADRRERELAAREEALNNRNRPVKKADEEDRTARVLAEERRAREREEEKEAEARRERESERTAREEEDRVGEEDDE
ncbi:MAG TPA: penicillin-binding transpeptidase domain-containing protein, partial [Thermoanaerobaculia bacterium]|nr:penicillin-binding transpeptidase domain-containing protein [Thermoanaerobaculia bacterium]